MFKTVYNVNLQKPPVSNQGTWEAKCQDQVFLLLTSYQEIQAFYLCLTNIFIILAQKRSVVTLLKHSTLLNVTG